MAVNGINMGQELLNVPMGEMIRSMALAIAEAQWQLDKSSMTVAELMSGRRLLRNMETGELIGPKRPDGSIEPTVIDSRVYFGYEYTPGADGAMARAPRLVSMMELGFTPTFYQFVDTTIEVKIAIKLTSETSNSVNVSSKTETNSQSSTSDSGGWFSRRSEQVNSTTVQTTQVDATYANKFSYSAEGASLLRTKLVPTPPPAIFEQRIRRLMEQEARYEALDRLIQLSKDPKLGSAEKEALTKRISDARDKLLAAGLGGEEN